MALYKQDGLTLSGSEALLPDDTPLIGWHNVVAYGGIVADSEDVNYPASNLTNPATNLEWRSEAAEAVEFTITFASQLIDYVGIAKHNFSTAGITVTVTTPSETITATPQDDEPLLIYFTPETASSITVELSSGSEVARAAVMYAGKLLVCERGVDVGIDFAAPRFARKVDLVVGRSARGDYLGSIVQSSYAENIKIDFKHFTPSWYRSTFSPFVRYAQAHHPFFWVWAPDYYPAEVAFAWFVEDPVAMTNPVTHRIAVTLSLNALSAGEIVDLDPVLPTSGDIPVPVISTLFLSSRLGVGADATHTVVTDPFFRFTLGVGYLAGDVITFASGGTATVTAAHISQGFIDVQATGLSGSASVQARTIRGAEQSALSSAYSLTIMPPPLDVLDNVYAAIGTQRLLSSYAGAAVRAVRMSDSAERDFDFMVSGFVDQGQIIAWAADAFETTPPEIIKTYDQSGNSRFFEQTSGGKPVAAEADKRGGYACLYFDGNRFMQADSAALPFANNQAAVTIAASLAYDAFDQESVFRRAAVMVSSGSGLSSARAGIGSIAAASIDAFGRRLDSDSVAPTTGLAAVAGTWYAQVARFSYSEAKLFHATDTAETLDPFQTAGNADSTDSLVIRIGKAAAAEIGRFEGRMTGVALIRDKLTDGEVTALQSSQADIESQPLAVPFIRVGCTASPEDFRAAIIAEVFSGNGMPTTGFTTSNGAITDPLAAYGNAPSNLDTVEEFEIEAFDDVPALVDTSVIVVWRPTSGTSNNKLVILCHGHSGDNTVYDTGGTLTTGFLVKELVEAGYTVARCFMGYLTGAASGTETTIHNALPQPTATFNPLAAFLNAHICTINALEPEGFDAILGTGISGGGWTLALLGAVDTRLVAIAPHAGFLPLYMSVVQGTGGGPRDYEQWLPGLWDLAATQGCDYTDLAVLCCHPNRTVLQSFNDDDPTVFPQAAYDAYTPYAARVAAVAALYGGTYSATWDVNAGHNFNSARRAAIIALFNTF